MTPLAKGWTMGFGTLLIAGAVALAACAPPVTPPGAGLISYIDLLRRPRAAPDRHIPYGPAPNQFAELWLPKAKGPYPVVVLIHGGCWLASLPGLELMTYMAEDLRGRGYAVWNIEYRRIGAAGGGWPGTFLDAGAAIDELGKIAKAYDLDLRRVVVVGHSAGGHLALWAAARSRLAKSSPLFTAHPLPLKGVVTLAGINDLAAYREGGGDACGGPPTIDALTGAGQRGSIDTYADTSPAALLPIGVAQRVVSGARDPIVPAPFGADYAAKAKGAGDPAEVMEIAGAGHFELIDPGSHAWKRIEPLIAGLLK